MTQQGYITSYIPIISSVLLDRTDSPVRSSKTLHILGQPALHISTCIAFFALLNHIGALPNDK